MEYSWILFSLAGLLALGIGDFIKKLILSKGIHKEVFLMSCFLLYIPAFWGMYFLFGTGVFQREEIVAAIIVGICNFFIPLGMLTAFKYLSVSFALVSIRLVSSFLILGVGVYILSDVLTVYNIIGFVLGAFAIFLLSGFRFGENQEMHLKGIIAGILCIVGIVVSNSYFKYILPEIDIYDYMPLQFSVTGILLTAYMALRKKFSFFTYDEWRKSFPYACITAIIFLFHFLYFLPNIYLLGTLSLSYKMLSYSLVVPIFLSIVFLGESLNRTRMVAFGLTIVSIFLFLI